MDREYYNSLTEAYNLIERGPTGGVKDAPVKIGDLFKPGKTAGTDRRSQAADARRTQQGNAPKPAPASSAPPASAPPASAPPASAPPASAPPASAPPAVRPKPQPAVSGTSGTGKPIRTSDVEARNAGTARRAAEVRRHGGDPTAGGEFKTKVTDTGSARLNKALTGIGKWNEELDPLAQHFVENNLCDSIESARVVLTHLDEEALKRLLS